MGKGMENLEAAYHFIFTAALIVLAILVILCLVRAIIGPRVADRIVSVNMTGTMVIVMIAILALMLEEGYLVDICIIYAMISFLAVIVLVKVYMGVYLEEKRADSHEEAATVVGPGEEESAGETGRADERKTGSGETKADRSACGQKVRPEETQAAGETGRADERKTGARETKADRSAGGRKVRPEETQAAGEDESANVQAPKEETIAECQRQTVETVE